jgi:hemerythrin-like domain-containing protein
MSAKHRPAIEAESNHPADILAREHDVVLSVLAAVESESRRLRRGAPMRSAWWLDAVLFFEEFGERCHHIKEEHHLFPALDGAGVLHDDIAVTQLCQEHSTERTLLTAVRDAALSADASRLADAADAYRMFSVAHIAKENSVLLELARHSLDGKAIQTIQLGFDVIGRLTMHLESELHALAHSLCRTAGVADSARPRGSRSASAEAC